MSVCNVQEFRYRDHTGWNTSKITSRLASRSDPNMGDLVKRKRPEAIGLNRGEVQKTCNVSETVRDKTKVANLL